MSCNICSDKGYYGETEEGTSCICTCEAGKLIARLQAKAQDDFRNRPVMISRILPDGITEVYFR